ncbi:MAG: stage 0 sporulation protein, partial [Myxococcales bacterium]|nr:stage 0 sporulation protein [Myxococcales bacterium]
MAQTVKVRLRKPGRVFTFISRNVPLHRNDTCIVRSDRGLEYGVCVMPPEDCSPEEEKRYKMTIVRRSTHHDDTTYRQIKIDEERAVSSCREKILERELPMKLVECEYAFDRKKVIFYFTAEDRVDFRELVRDLAQDLKARIELRHIQVRDEAKLVGGIGTCGRELCCTTWMREFTPISMKMAKR